MDSVARIGGGALMLAGLLHVLGVRFGGWNALTEQLLPIGMLYLVLGALVLLSIRGARWFAAIASGLGLIAAVQVMPTQDVPGRLMWTYIWLDVLVIGCLALSLRRSMLDG